MEDSIKKILKIKKKDDIYTYHFFQMDCSSRQQISKILFDNEDHTINSLIAKISNICNIHVKGIVEKIEDSNYAFVRLAECGYIRSSSDVYISPNKITKFYLRTGDYIHGIIKPIKDDDKYLSLQCVTLINDEPISNKRTLKKEFDTLTPIHPFEKFNLEIKNDVNLSKSDRYNLNNIARIIDLVCPIGMGQRGLIVAPPKSGKTIVIKSIAKAIMTNHEDVCLFVLLIDERPEEVTEMKRFLGDKGEVFASSFDEHASKHIYLAELLIERSKRLVEHNKNVVILLDSLTRLTRAYNLNSPSSGKVLSGGVDSNALNKPKRFFGSARKCENAGSLTIIASALIDTGSKMDEVIFEEFKGTGNLEIVLDRFIAESKIFPAIDLHKSSTRRDEYLIDKDNLQKIWFLKRAISSTSNIEAIKLLNRKIQATSTNDLFLKSLKTT